MEKYNFFAFFLDSLELYFNSVNVDIKNKDFNFVRLSKKGNNIFITIEDYVLESLVVLISLLSKEEIIFSCGIIYEEEVIVGVEVCINYFDLEKFNERFFSNSL